jgi:hypothetical protein
MPLYSINDPKHWLDRAKEARALAEQIADPETKRTILKNADDYERLAQEPKSEQQAAGHSQSSSSCLQKASWYLPTPSSVSAWRSDNVIALAMVC